MYTPLLSSLASNCTLCGPAPSTLSTNVFTSFPCMSYTFSVTAVFCGSSYSIVVFGLHGFG